MRVPEDRDARIAELQARLRARRASFVRAPVALICLAGALYLASRQWPDVAYALSATEPVTLGREGDYRLEALASNRYVQVHGTPAPTAFFGRDRQGPFVVVGLLDTPLLVRRAPLPSETWTPGRPPPPPERTPFAVRGRLLAEAGAPAYRDAFARARELPGLRPQDGRLYIILEGEHPAQDWGAVATAVVLLLFAAFNGWLLLDALRRR